MSKIKKYDFYEDCRFIPMFCIESNYKKDTIRGISLLDGKIGDCSPKHCAPRKITKSQALKIRLSGPTENVKKVYKIMGLKPWWN